MRDPAFAIGSEGDSSAPRHGEFFGGHRARRGRLENSRQREGRVRVMTKYSTSEENLTTHLAQKRLCVEVAPVDRKGASVRERSCLPLLDSGAGRTAGVKDHDLVSHTARFRE